MIQFVLMWFCSVCRYDIALFLLMYILPLIILFATYVPITVKLWSDRGLGEVTRAQVEGIKSKRKVSRSYDFLIRDYSFVNKRSDSTTWKYKLLLIQKESDYEQSWLLIPALSRYAKPC